MTYEKLMVQTHRLLGDIQKVIGWPMNSIYTFIYGEWGLPGSCDTCARSYCHVSCVPALLQPRITRRSLHFDNLDFQHIGDNAVASGSQVGEPHFGLVIVAVTHKFADAVGISAHGKNDL